MPGAYGYADPLFLLLAALALEFYVGRLGWFGRLLARPRGAAVRLARSLEVRLNRPQRSPAERRRRGWFVALLLLVGAGGAGWLLALFTRFYPFAWAVELVLLVLLLRQRRVWHEGQAVAYSLGRGDIQSARAALLRLTAGDLDPLQTERLSGAEVTPPAIAALARRLSDSLLAPVFWYVLLGLGGLAAQQMSLLLGRLYGGTALHDPANEPPAGPFAEASLRIFRLLEWGPSRLAGVLLLASAAVSPSSSLSNVLRTGASRRPWPEAVMLAAVGPPPLMQSALSRSLSLFASACVLLVLALVSLLLVRLVLAP